MTNRANLSADLDAMAKGPAGVTAPRTIYDTEDGIAVAYGTTFPPDGTGSPGYAPGCLFINTGGSNNTALYINEGTILSADFNPITGI